MVDTTKPKKPKVPKTPKEPKVVNGEAAHIGKAERMRLHLAKQPTVPIMIPLGHGEAPGSSESVILNGYRLNIRKGEYVHVPEQVARVIMESQQQTALAIEKLLQNECLR
jgi:hypothetical protein